MAAAALAAASGGECRLCLQEEGEALEEGEGDRLVWPCLCSTPVHLSCLSRWRQAQRQQAVEDGRSQDEFVARATTCDVCGARLITDGSPRPRPFASSAVCRAHGGFGKVALRRIPTLSRASRNFSEFSASEGQVLEVLEQDASGEFFRVRAKQAKRYREDGVVAVAEGWVRHTYLEWPEECRSAASAAIAAPRRPPAYAPRAEAAAPEVAAEGAEQAAAPPPAE
eukprot:CAMPEP_0204593102 /NCGR_PEP_ID=MMETSP0661-20131031/51320_1 /ASSEMBLY_ACC=CAM_ASM_000606 /TAXON_ID=109239 /ORGANISM="Alexandrium margalefi, Strain AMGDE01CS-322" /LENGTH=224 /DNA_ID=CAMNT_0051603387 /DNA_START=29 /DNA_END=700 /DNA_ORIENTATION=-